MTWSNETRIIEPIAKMMSGSWEACIHYTGPLGLHHLMAESHHYGPEPDLAHRDRYDWNNVYYHRADEGGIGFDRTTEGSDAVSQYHPPLNQTFNALATCPEKYLLWFHRVPWEYQVASGRTLWEEMQVRYNTGVMSVRRMQAVWQSLSNEIDKERFEHVQTRLEMQLDSAKEWRDVCLAYFGRFAESETKRQGVTTDDAK
jgi:alpha-glucuronidase